MATFNERLLTTPVNGHPDPLPFRIEWQQHGAYTWEAVPSLSAQRLSLQHTVVTVEEQKALRVRLRGTGTEPFGDVRLQSDHDALETGDDDFPMPQTDLTAPEGVVVWEPQMQSDHAYPFACGMYRIAVRWRGKSWWFVLEIKPLNLNHGQVEQMNVFLERHISGLSKNFESVCLTSIVMVEQQPDLSRWLMHEWDLFLKAAIRIERESAFSLTPVYQLQAAPRRETAKSVLLAARMQAAGMAAGSAAISGAGSVAGPASGMYVNRRGVATADSPLNQAAKAAVERLMRKIRHEEMLLVATSGHSSDARFRHLRNLYSAAYRRCQIMLMQPFWRGIRSASGNSVRINAQMPAHYREFFELIDRLERKQTVPVERRGLISTGWTVASRPTQELYEYFVYLVWFELLESIGFKPFDRSLSQRPGIAPDGLSDGSFVRMARGGQRIDLTFNQQLPDRLETARQQNHDFYMLMARHRKPDIRMDRYVWHEEDDGDGYWSICESVVAEVKYRPFKSLYDPFHVVKAMEQLRDYRMILWANDPPYGTLKIKPLYSSRPLTRDVICLYPGMRDRDGATDASQVLETGWYVQLRPENDGSIAGKEMLLDYLTGWLGDKEAEDWSD